MASLWVNIITSWLWFKQILKDLKKVKRGVSKMFWIINERKSKSISFQISNFTSTNTQAVT